MGNYDVLIVGAGPAGLATASGLSNHLSKLVIDCGKPLEQRNRYAPEDVTQGIGGAGLFSDGKFSFFPSSTRLWQLPNQALLKAAYEETVALLREYGLSPPPFMLGGSSPEEQANNWRLKRYPSFYMSPTGRRSLIRYLSTNSHAEFLTLATLSACTFSKNTKLFDVQIAQGLKHISISAKRIVLAGGRFGSVDFPLPVHKTFERLEVGIRIEQPGSESFFKEINQLDPKLKLTPVGQSREWRTFCACRDGEIIHTTTRGLQTVSGRADCPATGKSNIGFNVRIKDSEAARKEWQHIRRALSEGNCFFDFRLEEALQHGSSVYRELQQLYGPVILRDLLHGLGLLTEQFPTLLAHDTRIIGPSLEGVGEYPKLTNSLRVPHLPAWVVGDSTGKFRGIVAALVSGYYVAGQIKSQLRRRYQGLKPYLH